MALNIRAESPDDEDLIRQITELAFKGRPYAGGDEQEVIDRLRTAQALTISLVAELDGEIVGQITFSPAHQADGSSPWFALGPVSVLPTHQSHGIGSALINAGLQQIEALGALGCILTGNPDYYQRFGFELAPDNVPVQESPEFFMLKRLKGAAPDGRFSFHAAFYNEI